MSSLPRLPTHSSLRTQLADIAHKRQFSEKPTLRSAQAAMTKDDAYVDEESLLLINPDHDLVSAQLPMDDKGLAHYMHTGRTLTEQLSIMYACLSNGNIDSAQRMFSGLFRLYPDAMRDVADATVHNEIIYGLLNARPQPMTMDALRWYDKMDRQYGTRPNHNTFAIMISGFINCEMHNVALILMKEMLRCGYSFHSMILSPHLSDTDIDSIKRLAHEITVNDSENSEIATKVLQAVSEAEMTLSELSPAKKDGPNDHAVASKSSVLDQFDIPNDDTTLLGKIGSTTTKAEKTAAIKEELKATELVSTNVRGIKQLKHTLKSLYEDDLEGYNLQIRIERDTYDAALTRYREINEQRGDPLLLGNTSELRRLSASWLPQLESMIEEEQERCRQAIENRGADRMRAQYGQFFQMLDSSKIAIITILETLRVQANVMKTKIESTAAPHVSQRGVKTMQAVVALSNAVHSEIRMERMKKRNNRHIFGRNVNVAKLASSGKLFNMAIRRAKAKEVRESTGDVSWIDNWDTAVRTRIGSLLISMLIEAARVPEKFVDPKTEAISERMVPAFSHEYLFEKGRRYGIIAAHPILRDMFTKDSIVSIMTPRYLPMLVPPRPWLTYNSGGYLTKDEPCMRLKENKEQLRLLVQASNEDRLCTLLSGLDALGQTRWAINHAVFAAVTKVWNSGIELAEIPASHIDIPEPEKPANFDTDKKAKAEYFFKKNEWKNKRVNQHSMRCDCNYKVEIAKAFLNHPMYFPHNIDFRGRAYPIPPHFNHLGNDLCRGLLVFHEGRPLTERGLFWLKIHLANLVGKDKLSHQERLEFVEAHEKEIMAAADNPVPDSLINGDPNAPRPWWVDSENPWQTLAACIEYTAAVRSPNPAEYVSHLHIHQDGTCNGLQHYAAMGRDTKGAKEVNLVPSDRPQDVYSGILDVIIRLIDEDCKNGVQQALALQNKLTRKIVKQTVMTNVYGVTLIGAKEQIAARLREVKDDNGNLAFEVLEVNNLAMYVAKKIFESLGEMFTQAQQIQNWLNESARRIAKSMPASALLEWKQRIVSDKEAKEKLDAAKRKAKQEGGVLDIDTILEIRPDLGPGSRRRKRMDKLSTKPMATVTWTTPVGLTVTQPYRKYSQRLVNTQLQSISLYDTHMPSPVNSQKQKTAFPPNFVHSLDASHMVLSAIECKIAGLVFASVHDSYWTHACDVDRMNEILRDQFVKLHELDIMENLKSELEQRYADYKMPTDTLEYISTSSVKMAKKKTKSAKKAEECLEDEQLIESSLAKIHLLRCEDEDVVLDQSDLKSASAETSVPETENSGFKAALASASEHKATDLPSTNGHVKLVDLRNIKLIDPKEDLAGALKQEDCIAYTLSINAVNERKERAAVASEYRTKIADAKKKAKEMIKRKKAKTVAKSQTKPETDKAAENAEGEDENVEIIAQGLEHERRIKFAEIEAKFVTVFARKPIMVPRSQVLNTYGDVDNMRRQTGVSGRFARRLMWVDIEFGALPKQGDFDIKEVRNSPYFFS
ncbi:DNA-directed RNA polymerase [Coemansia sp. RSA 1646]|nr:DNA-directed RNA polymerase [Coemansia sp. RSA 1646]